MRKSPLLSLVILLTCAPAARTAQDAAGHFAKDGLSFDYPAGWTAEEKGDAETLRVVVRRAGGSAFIEVASPRSPVVTHERRVSEQERLWVPAVEEMQQRLGVKKKFPAKDEYRCPPFGERPGSGVILSGHSEGRGAKGEVYGMTAGGRYVNVSFFRDERDERDANAAWKTVLETLKAEGEKGGGKRMVMGVVVDGRAVSKPQPDYPENLKGVGGRVSVKVTIDEKGDVIEARADSGEPSLRAAAEAAAMRAKYTPTTLCGRPVKVVGVITYTFK